VDSQNHYNLTENKVQAESNRSTYSIKVQSRRSRAEEHDAEAINAPLSELQALSVPVVSDKNELAEFKSYVAHTTTWDTTEGCI
jgi:hypothetical protein